LAVVASNQSVPTLARISLYHYFLSLSLPLSADPHSFPSQPSIPPQSPLHSLLDACLPHSLQFPQSSILPFLVFLSHSFRFSISWSVVPFITFFPWMFLSVFSPKTFFVCSSKTALIAFPRKSSGSGEVEASRERKGWASTNYNLRVWGFRYWPFPLRPILSLCSILLCRSNSKLKTIGSSFLLELISKLYRSNHVDF